MHGGDRLLLASFPNLRELACGRGLPSAQKRRGSGVKGDDAELFFRQHPHGTLPQPEKALELLATMSSLVQYGHQAKFLWRRGGVPRAHRALAPHWIHRCPLLPPLAPSGPHLRKHYREEFKVQELGDRINFHPVYIARMQKEFGARQLNICALSDRAGQNAPHADGLQHQPGRGGSRFQSCKILYLLLHEAGRDLAA